MEQAVSVALRAAQDQDWLQDEHLLALIRFDQADQSLSDERVATVPLRQLCGTPMVETWTTARPVIERGRERDLQFAATEHTLFGHIRIDDAAGRSAEAAAEEAYTQILDFIAQRTQRHLLRMWNYLPAINEGDGDQERYRQFCVGRYRAFERAQAGENQQFPAATAIGSHGDGLYVSFLASTAAGQAVENPRQVSAFHYPRQYGPRSPSFSRATLKQWAAGGASLLVSGTASVVGHETHHGTLLAQLQETARNLQALQQQAGLPLRTDALRVYLRDPASLAEVREAVAQIDGLQAPAVYLHGDICRDDLILELEAVYSAA